MALKRLDQTTFGRVNHSRLEWIRTISGYIVADGMMDRKAWEGARQEGEIELVTELTEYAFDFELVAETEFRAAGEMGGVFEYEAVHGFGRWYVRKAAQDGRAPSRAECLAWIRESLGNLHWMRAQSKGVL